MKQILITGGAGNVGGSLARKLVNDPNNYVTILDDFSTGSKDKLPDSSFSNWRSVTCDVNEWEQLSPIMQSVSFDFVFHYAAVVGVKRTLDNPVKVLRDIDGIKNLLELAKNTGVQRVFYSSSSEVYGEPVEVPQHEHTTPLNSRLPYAVVKNVGESYFRSYHQEYGLEYTIFRFFNTFGPLQSTDFVISKFLGQAIKGEPITIYGDGQQTRTFCFIKDNIEATISCMENHHYRNEVVNIGSDHEISILDLARRIIALTSSTSEIVHVDPLAEGDMTRRQPDITRMKEILGRELTSLEEGINETWESFLRQES